MKKNQKAWSTNEIQNGRLKSDNFNPHYRSNKKLMKISARVTGQKLINNGKYTEYNIIISTEFNVWNIQKRYSEFDALNQSLIRKIPEINKLFPPKRFFKNSEETIDERVKFFNKYLHFLFNNYNIFLFDEVIDFICIDKKILELAMSKHTMGNKDKENELLYDSVKKSIQHLAQNERASSMENNSEGKKSYNLLNSKIDSKEKIKIKSKDSFINTNLNINLEINENFNENEEEIEEKNKNYFSTLLEYENSKKSSDDLNNESPLNKIIEDFLKNLNQKNDNKTAIIKSFEEFLKLNNSWPKFEQNEIIKLFIGIKNFKKLTTKVFESDKQNKKIINENDDNSNDNSNIRRAITNKTVNIVNFKKNSQLTKSMGMQLKSNEKIINDSLSYSSSSESDDDSNISLKNGHTINLLGLFGLIGKYEKNILLSVSCLDLLVKLLSYEYNPEAEFYINIFKGRRIADYQSLKLEDLIRTNAGGEKSVQNAMRILCILFRDDPHIEQYKRVILKNETVYKKFKIFEKNYYE